MWTPQKPGKASRAAAAISGRWLALGRGGGADILLTFDELMSVSGAHLEHLAGGEFGSDTLVATRILGTPKESRHWETEHAQLMHGIAALTRRPLQLRSLLFATLSLLHRKSLFEYLRNQRLPSNARYRLMTHFHGHHDHVQMLLAEHGRYLRSAASFLCTAHIGAEHLQQGIFGEPLYEYSLLYSEYFSTYCDVMLLPDSRQASRHLRRLLPQLKMEVLDARNRLLAYPVRR